ncbi:MAG: hypothetical protein ACLFUJ_09600 [Phycisphaerae bacterium]
MTEERENHPEDPLTRPPGYENVDPAELISHNPDCLEVLGLRPGCSIDQVQDAYRRKVYQAQMDVAGAQTQMPRLNQALAQAIRYVERSGPLADSNLAPEDMDQPADRPQTPPTDRKQGRYQRQDSETSTPAAKTPRKVPLPQRPARPSRKASADGTEPGEVLLGRFETQIALQMQKDPQRTSRGLYIVGSKKKSFPARMALTSRRCLFESEYSAPAGLLRRNRYHRIRGTMAAEAVRAIHKRPDGSVEIHLAPHGPLQAMYPNYTNWVIRLAHLPAKLTEALRKLAASPVSPRPSNDLGVLEVTRL